MKRCALLLGALACATTTADAQATRGRNWTIFNATGWMAVSGAGSGTLMGERIPGLFGLRFRLEDGDWWMGIELEAWAARATQAGRDSIIARSLRINYNPTGRASFYSTTLSFTARRDVWHAGPADAYLIGTLGASMSGGRIVGKCGTNVAGYPVCTEPPLDTRGPGMAVAAGVGGGVTVRYSDLLKPIPKWASWVLGERVILETRLASQEATEGRLTSATVFLGIGW